MTRRRWDYFVRYLAGNIPPKEYEMKSFGGMQSTGEALGRGMMRTTTASSQQ